MDVYILMDSRHMAKGSLCHDLMALYFWAVECAIVNRLSSLMDYCGGVFGQSF